MKYFRSVNYFVCKISATAPIHVSLSLVASFSTPVLLSGFDSGCLSNAQIERLKYPFGSIYPKLFATFDKSVIMQCQFYRLLGANLHSQNTTDTFACIT